MCPVIAAGKHQKVPVFGKIQQRSDARFGGSEVANQITETPKPEINLVLWLNAGNKDGMHLHCLLKPINSSMSLRTSFSNHAIFTQTDKLYGSRNWQIK